MELEYKIDPKVASDAIIYTLQREHPYFKQFSSMSDIYNKTPINIVETLRPNIQRNWRDYLNEEGNWNENGINFVKQFGDFLEQRFKQPNLIEKKLLTTDQLIDYFRTQHPTLSKRNTIPENYDPNKWKERLEAMEQAFKNKKLPIIENNKLTATAQTYLETMGEMYNNFISKTYNSKNPENYNMRAGVVKDTMRKLPDIEKVLKESQNVSGLELQPVIPIEVEEQVQKIQTKTKSKPQTPKKQPQKKRIKETDIIPIETEPTTPTLRVLPQQEPVVPIAELRALNREAEENANIPQEQLREKYDFQANQQTPVIIQPQAQPEIEVLPNPQPRLQPYFTDIDKELEEIENQPQPVIVQQPVEPVVIQPQPQPNLFVNPQQRKEVEQRLKIEIEQVKLKTLQAVSEGIDNIFGKDTGVYIKLLLSYLGILGVGGVITKKLLTRKFKIFDDDEEEKRRKRYRRPYYYY
jgi:hypothetical protein